MDSAVKRPWYRLHWVTVVVIFAVVWSLTGRQFERHFGGGTQDFVATVSWWYLGWPSWHLEMKETGVGLVASASQSSFEYKWRPAGIVLNGFACACLLASTVVVFESWLRSSKRLQISLWHLFIFMSIVATMLGLVLHGHTLQLEGLTVPRPRPNLIGWDDLAKPWRWPLLLSLSCTIYSLGWLALALLRRAYRVVRP